MMQEKWNSWTKVERMIIAGTALFAILVGLVFGVVVPLQSAKQEALLARDQAAQDVVLVENGIASLRARAGQDTGLAVDLDRFRLRVTDAAQSRGLSIARLQNGSEGSVQLIFGEAAPTAVYQWLDDISTVPGARVISGNLTGRDDGVDVEIELRGAKP